VVAAVRHDKARPPGRCAEGVARSGAAEPQIDSIIAQRHARARLAAQDRHLRITRMAHQAMPLTVYYGPRPLRDVPLGQFLVEEWWAA
jgi:hypothetical protein